MNDKVSPISKSIEQWKASKHRGSLSEAVETASIDFKDDNQGKEVLAFAAAIRALGLSNRDLQPRKLSNYIRSGYLQIQIICSVILFQFRGDAGVSRDDLYDSVCDVFPATTFANFRKVLSAGVDSDIFLREKDSEDSRRTLYTISEAMLTPLTQYFRSTLKDFDHLYLSVFDGALEEEEINNLRAHIIKGMVKNSPNQD
ncbi:MAG TPA: hypothetical protein QGF66_00360 [SAR86 cluster bacterium]|nr:hypothetical protein [SAR86 cluster bacterium]